MYEAEAKSRQFQHTAMQWCEPSDTCDDHPHALPEWHSLRCCSDCSFPYTCACWCSMTAAEDLKEMLKARESDLHAEMLRADAAEHRCSLLEERLRDSCADGHAGFNASPVQRTHQTHANNRDFADGAWPGSPAPSTAPHTPHVPSTIPYESIPHHTPNTSQQSQACSARALAAENAQLKEEKNLLCIQLAVRLDPCFVMFCHVRAPPDTRQA